MLAGQGMSVIVMMMKLSLYKESRKGIFKRPITSKLA